MARDTPIGDAELGALFAGLDGFRSCVLAVSGGADSMALMHLVARWRQLRGDGPDILIATVDHRLREGSAEEAAAVAKEARRLGLEHRTLVRSGPRPTARVEELAREARYALLVEAAKSCAAPVAIVTAHTQDDQAETLLMRLARGSGVDGLAGMQPVRGVDGADGVAIVRPLIGVAKSRLKATLEALGVCWFEDPSNQSAEFERVRLRQARDDLAWLGLESDKIALSARRLQRAQLALNAATDELQKACVDVHGGAFASIKRDAFQDAPEEIQLRLLTRVIAKFGGNSRPALMAQVEELAAKLARASVKGVTLGGTIVAADQRHIKVFREPGREGLAEVTVEPGARQLWDGRFVIGIDLKAKRPIKVRALGADAYATLKRELPDGMKLPARAAATLPSLWQGERLLVVPHLLSAPQQTENAMHEATPMRGERWTLEFVW